MSPLSPAVWSLPCSTSQPGAGTKGAFSPNVSKNHHRMVGLGRDPKDHLCPPPLPQRARRQSWRGCEGSVPFSLCVSTRVQPRVACPLPDHLHCHTLRLPCFALTQDPILGCSSPWPTTPTLRQVCGLSPCCRNTERFGGAAQGPSGCPTDGCRHIATAHQLHCTFGPTTSEEEGGTLMSLMPL